MSHKLLLADDSVTIQRVIELTFADEDVAVIAVGDGKQAIARIESDRPDIVLADVGMPEHDGYEVSAFVKQRPDLAHIPVLLLTGAFEPVDEARARSVGCDGVLVKPFEPQMVINRVKDLLAGGRAAPRAVRSQVATPVVESMAPRPVAEPAATTGASLEDYFDRLDAAFASLDGGSSAGSSATDQFAPEGPPAGSAAPRSYDGPAGTATPVDPLDDLAGWDPDLAGDPERRAPMAAWEPLTPVPPPVPVAAPAPPAAAVPAPPPEPPPRPVPAPLPPPAAAPHAVPVVASSSLADAFSALLAAEQGLPFAAPAAAVTLVSRETLDEAVRRVLEGMSAQVVRETVADIAERLVREEIDRIKSQA